MARKIYFYPHSYLRDRQLDTVRHWPRPEVINAFHFEGRTGKQVSRSNATKKKVSVSWKQRLPLINVKLRPSGVPDSAAIYVWGAILATGAFIVDLDNPYSLVGYNFRAMPLWKWVLRKVLLSQRCLEIRCMSEACRQSLGVLFGEDVARKATVHYPVIPQQVTSIDASIGDGPNFLFIGTQFEIKGGVALLVAWSMVIQAVPDAKLDIVTHLPDSYIKLAKLNGVTIHEADFDRAEIWAQFMKNADVLVHPSYMESFGMVVLEALSHGLAIIANDVYAHREMVIDGENGILIEPPVKYWNNGLAGPLFKNQENAVSYINNIDKTGYIKDLASAITQLAQSGEKIQQMRQRSCLLFTNRFALN